ncbi:hypothetical protein QJS10_CPB19g01275 [Acorus calamus]|uniref:Uncharacterized protein n=1 Tax=Acorus calamus TaxID=4465 RepID=A0AAV9CIZ5_ACOCL|nr:hypothetical protein QJS10_CPB19g01275 [Acorus calamus]
MEDQIQIFNFGDSKFGDVRDESSQEWYPNASLFGQFPELKELYLSSNGIAGWINPQDIWHLQKVQQLDMSFNNLNDESIARLIVPWIYNLTSLFELGLSGNNLKEINWISNITSLRSLDLSSNQIKDFSDLCQLQDLQFLYLSENSMKGNIDTCGFWGLQNLEHLDLSLNQIESVGSGIFNITSARHIDLSNNMIKDLPSDLCQLQDLQQLDLTQNSMKGNIDTCLKSLVPTQVCHMQNLHILDLSNNYLTGTIPRCLKNISSWIIDSPTDYERGISDIENIFGFYMYAIPTDLVVTSLTTKGEIPSQLVKLHTLSVFRVAYNNLSGIIPYKDQFCTFNKSSFEGNPGLSGVLIEKNCWSMQGTSQTYHDSNIGDHEDTSKTIDNDVIFYSFIAASFAIGFWGVIAVLAFNKNGRIKFFMAADDFLYACMDDQDPQQQEKLF